mmetsp:Transcript_14984/g.60156  ORF Transcript_14984/g.60156 Transcript_14984/m.60156 type:complete len:89 (+) Transcript_14984:638-904(+)
MRWWWWHVARSHATHGRRRPAEAEKPPRVLVFCDPFAQESPKQERVVDAKDVMKASLEEEEEDAEESPTRLPRGGLAAGAAERRRKRR